MTLRMDQTTRSLAVRNMARFSFEFIEEKRIELMRELSLTLRAEIKNAGSLEEHKESFQYPVSRVHGRISTLPFRFDSEFCQVDKTIDHLLQSSKSLDLDSPIRILVIEICKLLIELLRAGDNPLFHALQRALDPETMVVIKDSYWTAPLQKFLHESTERSPRVVNVNRLGDESLISNIVYLGSPTLLAYKFLAEPDTRFLLDPKAEYNHFIMYPFGNLKEIPGIIETSRIGRTLSYNTPVVFYDDDLEITTTDWSSISSKIQRARSDTEIREPARFAGLAGGYHIWLNAKPDSRCRVLAFSQKGDLEIEARQTSELREGDMIVERIGKSSPSLIDSVADGLGATRYRSSQAKWKTALQGRISEVGNLRAVERILAKDFKVDVLNLRHWAYDPRSIAPASRNDFISTCSYLGIGDSALKLWNDLSEVRKFHLKAGNEISSRLKEAVRQLSVEQIRDSQGMLTIQVKDCGALGLFRVEHFDAEIVKIPISEIDVISTNSGED